MNVWLIQIGEPLPIDTNESRLLRTGLLAKRLLERNHNVLWWTSTFDHSRKKHRFEKDHTVNLSDHFSIKLLHSIAYSENISLRRIINHIWLARKFNKLLTFESKPDIIVCSFPTIELSFCAVNFARTQGIPIVIDVRDLWPDIFIDVLPDKMKWLGRICFRPFYNKTQKIFQECSTITAISEKYLDWGLSYARRIKNEPDSIYPLGYEKPCATEQQIDTARCHFNKLGIDPEKNICWFVGAFGKTYDLMTVIAAAKRLEKDGLNSVQFVLSGNGENYLKSLKAASGLRNVIFTGWIDTTQLVYLMSIVDIGLMAYADKAPQGLPNKLFEYLSAGLPILSSLSEDGETAQLLNKYKCGLTYKAGNSDAFIKQLNVLLLDDRLRRTMGDNAIKLFEDQFAADAVYSRMAEYLEGIAAQCGTWNKI
jgi:glycosyltransferase involved in cell wall biosynthesis